MLAASQGIFRSDVAGREQKQGLRVAVALTSLATSATSRVPFTVWPTGALYVVALAPYEDFTH